MYFYVTFSIVDILNSCLTAICNDTTPNTYSSNGYCIKHCFKTGTVIELSNLANIESAGENYFITHVLLLKNVICTCIKYNIVYPANRQLSFSFCAKLYLMF